MPKRQDEISITESVFGKPNVLIQPNEQSRACSSYAVAQKRALKRKKKRSRLRKILRTVFLVIGIVGIFFTLAISSIAVYVKTHKDEITQILFREINKSLQAPISVQNITVSFLRDFPMVSVTFDGVQGTPFDETGQDKEDLFYVESLRLTINLHDIIHGRYIVRELLVRGGDFNLKHYGKGRFNYEIWKKNENAGALDFHLNRVLLHNSLIRYRDIVGHHDYQVLARKAVARGDLYENGQDFAVSGDIRIHSLKASDFVFMTDHKAMIDLEFGNNTTGRNFEVRKGKVSIENMTFGMEGYVHYIKSDAFLDFLFDGKNLKIEQLTALLPEEVQSRFEEYTFRGNTAFKMEIKGDYTTSSLGLYTRFSFSNGTVSHKKSGITAKHVEVNGDLSNGLAHKAHSARLHLDRIYLELAGGAIDGAFSLNNFKTPEISFKGNLAADMAELQKFFGFSPDFRYEGMARAEVDFYNRFPSLSPDRWKALDFGSAKLKGFLQVDKAAVALTNRNWDRVEIDSIRIAFTPEVFRIPPFTMRYGKDEIRLKVFIENALPYCLLPMQKLYVNASLSSSRIDMNLWQTLLQWGNPDSVRALRPASAGGDAKRRPAKKKSSKNLFTDLYADFDVDVNRVIWKNLDVSPLKGLLRYTPEDIALENLSVGAFQGVFDGEVLFDGHSGEKSELRVAGKLDDMDVGACLKAFDNFGQTQITYKNLGGTLSADLRLRINREGRNGQWKKEDMVFWSELVLRNGILQNVETLKKIARFTGENDLQNIHFADLRTTLEIQNACIKIHHMDVVSDAANLTFSGTHTFDNEVNYLLNIDLSDFLSRRRAQRVKEESEFGVVVTEKSRVRLPLSIKGKLPDVEVKYAMSEAKKGAKERLKENRRDFKVALDEEFSANRQKRTDRKVEQEKTKRRENGEFILDLDETEILKKDNTSGERVDTVGAAETKSKKPAKQPAKKYDTREDFRIQFEDE